MRPMHVLSFVTLLCILLSISVFISVVNAVKFWSVDFNVDVKETTATVGKPFELPIYIKNNGVLADTYTLRINATGPYAGYVLMDQNVIITKVVEYGETEKISNKIIVTSSVEVPLDVWVYSNSDMIACIPDSDPAVREPMCGYIGDDYDCDPTSNKCAFHKTEVKVRTGILSLPEFDWYGLIVIMSVAAVMFATSKNFK